jgi:AcrR family transcriptional regulator
MTSTSTHPSTDSTTPTPTHTTSPRRERARAATIEEIKQTALDLMRESRSTDIRFTDIAKGMGLTPPALYRYFDDRDALLTALITDAYGELGDRVRDAITAVPADDLWGRWVAAGESYRTWAREDPERFSLILGMPISGFIADEDGPTTEAAKRAMSQLASLFGQAAALGELGRPLIREVSPALAACAEEKHSDLEPDLPVESFQAMLHAWAGLHGFTSLEAYGHLDWLGDDGRDALFLTQLELIARTAGLPGPPG